MSVVNGQIANQTTFNNAFMSRTAAATSTVAKVALSNTDLPDSGVPITNAQKAINKAFEGVGALDESDTTVNDYSSQNYITNGDNRKVAVGKLDTQLKSTQDDLDAAEVRLTDIESNPSTFGGDKIFSDDVLIQGNLEVLGATTKIFTTDLEVEDTNILVNKGGTDLSSAGAGLTVERVTENAAFQFDNTLTSKFKIGLISALYEIVVSGIAQIIEGIKDFVDGLKVDIISESTLNSGVTIDGVLIKDGLVDGRDVSTDGTAVDDHETRIDALEASGGGGFDVVANQNIAGGGQIALSTKKSQLLKVAGSGGAQDASLTPFSGTPSHGMVIYLKGTHATNTLKITHNDAAGGVMLNGPERILALNETFGMYYDLTDDRYYEIGGNF